MALHSAAVLPVVEKLLEAPDDLTDLEIIRSLALIHTAGSPYPALRPVIRPYLRSEEAEIRLRAQRSLWSETATTRLPWSLCCGIQITPCEIRL